MNALAPTWRFRILSADEVELEPTQRDQFNNDEVGLADALVRESIQNSTDAANGIGTVKVRFSLLELSGSDASRLRSSLDTLQPHLIACGIHAGQTGDEPVRLLVIEDFNTTGLTGDPSTLDNSHFRNFWRVHGRSGKSGKASGRWGLGKLVYSSSSKIHAFFGCTLRNGDSAPLLMGQAVLLNHQVGGQRHPAHGFWFSEDGPDGIQLPIVDKSLTSDFSDLACLERGNNPGLSLIIPYPLPGITEEALLSGVVQNYYFPILAGRLVVEIGSRALDRLNFLETAAGVKGVHIPFPFVNSVSERLGKIPTVEAKTSIEEHGLSEDHFTSADLEFLRAEYTAGKLVHVAVPIRLSRKDGSNHAGAVDLFLQKPPEAGDSFALFVRGALTVPGEKRYFAGIPAYGAMVASEEGTASFLGDAENPAHTSWNPQAEKVTANWRNPYVTLKGIRNGLRSLHSLLAEHVEQSEPDALIDFFSLVDANPVTGQHKKKTPIPNPVVAPRERSILVKPVVGGFAIVPGPGAINWTYPKTVTVRAAYDMIGANPFKRFNKFDFDLSKDIEIELKDIESAIVKPNVLQLTLRSPDFALEASGFDPNRDLVVEARSKG
ncbi:hypothetical protein [Phyllobacterium sophorae]|uniref:Uncharacterized protein n=1 Tax=Phyllobacterium sophorae TaxID=1520277 RepID=A0A2P7AQ14_9HYPH|nr:hypothetical protein [Phyllobacterium sophorae]PSH56315.1 hypothetical protein CU103_30105 [Phyllobacterium sophorae]